MKNSNTSVKNLKDVLTSGEAGPAGSWHVRIVSSGDCQSYVIWNTQTHEGLVIDPKLEDRDAYLQLQAELGQILWLGVIDTHTHADHISVAAQLSELFHAPLIMHCQSASSKIHLRVSQTTALPSHAGLIRLILTPGHTPDGICVVWGPFAFTGDTLLFGDVGRDDLPGGNPAAHFDSLNTLRGFLQSETLILPGHDNKGGRVSSWATQLKVNSSLTQSRETFIEECTAFNAPAPALFKQSLFENMK